MTTAGERLAFEPPPLVADAHALAREGHAGQRRKANEASYLSHAVVVAEILAAADFDDEVIAAGLLHDTVEHTGVELDAVRTRFGQRVGSLVAAMTDREEIADWERRKDEHRGRVAGAGRDAAAIYGADKLCGIREAREGYAELAEDVEERLGNPLDLRLRAWNRDLEMLAAVDPPLPIADEIALELERLRGDRAASPLRR